MASLQVDAFLEKQARQLGDGDSDEEEGLSEGDEDFGDGSEASDEEESPVKDEEETEAETEEGDDPTEDDSEVDDPPLDVSDEEGDSSSAEEASVSKRQKRRRQGTPYEEDPRIRALKRHLDERAVAGSAFADAEGLEDLLD